MISMDSFTAQQRDLLVALPYRVGLWISRSDSTGGDAADDAELQALNVIVAGFAEDFCKSEFIQTMMEETVARRAEWSGWAGGLNTVPDECSRAIDILSERLDRKDIASFKVTLMDIAVAVAVAYREDDGVAGRGRGLLGRLGTLLTRRQSWPGIDGLSISAAERRALETLSRVLETGPSDVPSAAAG